MTDHRTGRRAAAALGLWLGLLLAPPPPTTAAGPQDEPTPTLDRPGRVTDPMDLDDRSGTTPGRSLRPDLPLGLPMDLDLTPEQIEAIDATLLENILMIQDPSERSLALVRAAQYKLIVRDFETVRRALGQAAEAAMQIVEPLRRDLRLIAINETLIDLAQEDINDAVAGSFVSLTLDPLPEVSDDDRIEALERAFSAFSEAIDLASRIQRPNYRAEALYFAIEQQAQGGQAIGVRAIRDPGQFAENPELLERLRAISDQMIRGAAEQVRRIDRPVWRDVALTSVARSAATSNQFDLAFDVARRIPGPELRFEALVIVAEADARRGSPERATAVFREAAGAVAQIPIADLRNTLTNVLVESLIASGRFDDARRCVGFYANDLGRLDALGSIARAMGSRGMAEEARQWIDLEVLPQYRDQLYRRVNDGVLAALERYGTDSYLNMPLTPR